MKCFGNIGFSLMLICLMGCPKNADECARNFYLSGIIKDGSNSPIVAVEVYQHNDLDTTVERLIATTDVNGQYSYFVGTYNNLDGVYAVFKKAGYQNLQTAPYGKGSGACGDQQIVRDGTLVP